MCLTEEVILSMGEEGTGGFTKFIHNANATIWGLNDPTSNEMTEFLSFTQHKEYTKVGSLVLNTFRLSRSFQVSSYNTVKQGEHGVENEDGKTCQQNMRKYHKIIRGYY